jgi:hypothetical protein
MRKYVGCCLLLMAAAFGLELVPAHSQDKAKKDQEITHFAARSPKHKAKLVSFYGGNDKTEAAVALGLAWLATQQQADGSWKFDGNSKDQIAATGFALLPFLGAGYSDVFEELKGDSEEIKRPTEPSPVLQTAIPTQ